MKHLMKKEFRQIKLMIRFKDFRLGLMSDITPVLPKSTIFSHHGMNVVIGRDVKLGKNVKIYHNVTIGNRRGIGKDKARDIIIGNNVTIYTGATILGNVKIGDNAVIAAHSLVLSDVPPNMVAMGAPAHVIAKDEKPQK